MFLLALLAVPVVLALSLQERTVSTDILSDLKLFAEYSAAAYCSDNYVASYDKSLGCPDAICPQVQNESVEIFLSFKNIQGHGTTGMVEIDHTNSIILISFRGTVSDADWETNLDFILTNASDICEDCYVHAGFLGSWRAVQNIVINAWKSAQQQYPTYQTVVTGHSLGGALANLCAAKLANDNSSLTIRLYTYGSPRVGDPAFVDFIQTRLGHNNFRVTHLNDPIPRLPGRHLGFLHPSPEYHITSPHIPHVLSANYSTLSSPANLVVNPSDMKVLSREESSAGTIGYKCSDIEMHDTYFVPIAGCVPGGRTPLLEEFAEDICHVLDICCNAG